MFSHDSSFITLVFPGRWKKSPVTNFEYGRHLHSNQGTAYFSHCIQPPSFYITAEKIQI